MRNIVRSLFSVRMADRWTSGRPAFGREGFQVRRVRLLGLLVLGLAFLSSVGFAGSATIFTDANAIGYAQGAGYINFDSYRANSISISIGVSADAASQQGGGRGYRGFAQVVVGPFLNEDMQDPGSDPMRVSASLSLTVTKEGDGNWYSGGTNLGHGVNVSVYAYADGENAVGGGYGYCTISWVDLPSNRAPSISWTSSPGTVVSGQSYTISAHGHDEDGNLVAVSIWKNGQPFAFAGGGNGTDGDSQNPTSDVGTQTVTFTAQAFDSEGQSSAIISQSVTIVVPNQPPTIEWTSFPDIVASDQSYTISAHGHDNDGNLVAVSIWKNGQPFAFAGGGDGTNGDSQNPTSDSGPATVTFNAQAFDANGAASGVITQTVTIRPPNHAPTIAWNVTPGSVSSGQSYTISAHGHDQDGNLTQVNIWRNGQPYAFAGGGGGYDNDSGNPSVDTGPQTITYTAQAVDGNGATSATISQTVTINAANHAPTIAWNVTPGSVSSGQNYTISAHGHDQDGNLTQVNVWRNGQPYAFAGGGNGYDNDSGNATSDAGPQTITFTAQAFDSDGGSSATISQTVTVNAPPPTQYTLTTSAAAGGSVTNGGTYVAGATVSITAIPDGQHDFVGWSGDAGGSSNPMSVTLDRNKSVQANFSPKMFVLTTSTSGGGSVTPGGSYAAGSWVSISASPDATHKFAGWMGDVGGTTESVAIYLDRSKAAEAVFASKASQTISFSAPSDLPAASPPFSLNAVASSGLPVSFAVISGPATLSSGQIYVTGPGAVTVQATQAGDADYLPAAPVTHTFNVIAPVSLKYRPAIRVLLNGEATANTAPLVIEKP